jgi:hypothetical protein
MSGKVHTVKVYALWLLLGLVATCLQIGASHAFGQSVDGPPDSLEQERASASDQEFPVPFKGLPKTITPCRACHGPEKDFPVNFKRREDLLVHKNVKLNHGGVKVWCLDCHHPEKRDYLLPLSDGKLIPFSKSYLLCGKCHGVKYRDWRNGIHGKRTGYWNGPKTYYLCVNCHNPHSPRFKAIEPMPPPRKPWTPKEKRAAH